MEKSLISAGVPVQVLNLLLIHASLSGDIALQSETKCYNPDMYLKLTSGLLNKCSHI